jgi:antitoxin ParD1/3/4
MITAAIPAEFESFVQHQLATGAYESAQQVVGDALRLLRDQKLETLRKEIQEGLDSLNRGEGIPIDTDEELDMFFDGIEKEALAELEAERKG